MVRNPDNCRSLPRVHGRGMLPTFEITNSHCVLTHNATAKHLRFDANNPAPILISDGEKGGIGKSHLERLLAYLMSAHSVQWQGFDLDPRNSHLARFHPKVDVRRLDWNDAAAWEDLYHGIMQVDSKRENLPTFS